MGIRPLPLFNLMFCRFPEDAWPESSSAPRLVLEFKGLFLTVFFPEQSLPFFQLQMLGFVGPGDFQLDGFAFSPGGFFREFFKVF
jgi:hypothetical protein